MTRVFIVAESARSRERLEDLLHARRIEVVGNASNLENAAEMLAEELPAGPGRAPRRSSLFQTVLNRFHDLFPDSASRAASDTGEPLQPLVALPGGFAFLAGGRIVAMNGAAVLGHEQRLAVRGEYHRGGNFRDRLQAAHFLAQGDVPEPDGTVAAERRQRLSVRCKGEVAHALRRTCRASDVAARTGGDEFAVLAPMIAGPAALELANRIRATLATVERAPTVSIFSTLHRRTKCWTSRRAFSLTATSRT